MKAVVRIGKSLVVCLPILLSAGCAALPEGEDWRDAFPFQRLTSWQQAQELSDLLGYAHQVQVMSPGQLKRESSRLQTPHMAGEEAVSPLERAVYLAIAAPQFRNTKRAEKILNEYLDANKRRESIQDFAVLLNFFLAERLNLEHRLDMQKQRAEQELAKEVEQRRILEEKLEALLAIEKTLTDRKLLGDSAP